MVKLPPWVQDKIQCLFCRQGIEPTSIEIVKQDKEEFVRVEYMCINPDCPHRHLFGRTNKQARLFSGNYVELYKKFRKLKTADKACPKKKTKTPRKKKEFKPE